MRAKGFGEAASMTDHRMVGRVRPGPPRGLVRLQPETWRLLASLRRPLVDSEGNLVGLESFDRLVRRILSERKNAQKPTAPPREATR
jgi:hypothetical protein